MSEKKYPIGGYAPGNYHCHCATCGCGFEGDKRACQCEPCALNDKAKFDALSPEEQDELMKRNAEAIKEAFSNFRKQQKTNPEKLTTEDYEAVLADHRRLVRELDVIINGEDAAKQAKLCDMVSQIRDEWPKKQEPVWVKASERLPEHFIAKFVRIEGVMSIAAWHKDHERFIDDAGDFHPADQVEWLDESGTPAAGSEKPTLTQSRADFIREVNERDMEGMEVIEFAEWAPTIAFFDDEYRLWELLKEGEFINGQFRFTTKELYKLFKQQKDNP